MPPRVRKGTVTGSGSVLRKKGVREMPAPQRTALQIRASILVGILACCGPLGSPSPSFGRAVTSSCDAPLVLTDPLWTWFYGDTTGESNSTLSIGGLPSEGNDAYWTFHLAAPATGQITFSADYEAAIYLSQECGAQISTVHQFALAAPGQDGTMPLARQNGAPLDPGTWYLVVSNDPTGGWPVNGPYALMVTSFHTIDSVFANGFDP